MMAPLIQILTGSIGTLGYAMGHHVRARNLIPATAGGFIAWAVYLWVFNYIPNYFIGNLISAIAVYTWSEIMARVMKAPVTIFLVPGIIPLLPGSFLYYTMYSLVNHDVDSFLQNGYNTAIVTVGIACGIVISSVVIAYFLKIPAYLKQRRKRKQ